MPWSARVLLAEGLAENAAGVVEPAGDQHLDVTKLGLDDLHDIAPDRP